MVNQALGINGPKWLTDPSFMMLGMIIVGVWSSVGYNMIILLAGLKNIPRAYYEAAMIDGATSGQQFRKITVPLLSPVLFFVSITSLMGGFKVFDIIYTLAGSGSTADKFMRYYRTMVYGIYEKGFLYQEAYGDMLGVVSLPIMKEATTISHSLSWVGAATTKHPDEVKKFLTYLAGYEAQAQAAQAVIPAYEGTPELWAAKFAEYNTDAFLGPIASGAAHPLPAANKNIQQIFARFNDYMTEMLSTGDIEANLAAMEAEFNELLK